MRAWSTIYNIFAVLLMLYMIMVLVNDVKINEKQFEEQRLRYAVDYATEGAFMASLEGGNIGISYEDLQNVRINPTNTLGVFKSILALNYDMSMSQENLDSFDRYISSAVLAVSDGYYIASMEEIDTDNLTDKGGEYALKWGLKKPYVKKIGDKYIAYNISTQYTIVAKQNNGKSFVSYYNNWEDLRQAEGINLASSNDFEDPKVQEEYKQGFLSDVNNRIMDDINYNIQKRNENGEHVNDFVYLPAIRTDTGINPIKRPSIFITLSGVDFAGSQKIDAKSVGGYTITKKRRILGFTENGHKYYCYEYQLPKDLVPTVEYFYNTMEEAVLAGYRPHLVYLKNNQEIK